MAVAIKVKVENMAELFKRKMVKEICMEET